MDGNVRRQVKKFFKKLWIYIRPFFDWKFLISFGIPWFLVNGWAYVGVALISVMGMNWFTTTSSTWLAILWLPFTPEKLITIPIALWLHTRIFKKDKKTKAKIEAMNAEAKKDWETIKSKFKRKKDKESEKNNKK